VAKHMKKSIHHSFAGIISTVLFFAGRAHAQNLFVADSLNGNISEVAPGGGTSSTFASGFNAPHWMAFNSAGDLFIADSGDDLITEITPGGTRSTFATVAGTPVGLAFNAVGDLFVSEDGVVGVGENSIIEITPGKTQSVFATGLNSPRGLAFNSAGDLFVANANVGDVIEFTPGGTGSVYASDLDGAAGLAFEGQSLPLPEPASGALIAAGALGYVFCGKRHRKRPYAVDS
jgi:hypothetical protein